MFETLKHVKYNCKPTCTVGGQGRISVAKREPIYKEGKAH